MKRTALAGLFLCAVIFAATNSKVSAEAAKPLALEGSTNIATQLAVLEMVEQQSVKEEEVPASQPVEHAVAAGENLSTIASQYQTTWQRLYNKNTHVEHPDIITVGEKLVIPSPDEQLAERALPVIPTPAPVAPAQPRQAATRHRPATQKVNRGSVAGNSYTPGYCTWYVKNRRPDLPNNLGDAYTWVSRAAAQGLATGSTPRPGAAGQRGNHVVYVESVNADGSVNISEMNHQGLYVITHRTLPASYFQYIY